MTEPIPDVQPMDALLIIAQRCYDMLSVIAGDVDPEGFEQILRIHAAGGFFGPEPSYISTEEDNGTV